MQYVPNRLQIPTNMLAISDGTPKLLKIVEEK